MEYYIIIIIVLFLKIGIWMCICYGRAQRRRQQELLCVQTVPVTYPGSGHGPQNPDYHTPYMTGVDNLAAQPPPSYEEVVKNPATKPPAYEQVVQAQDQPQQS